MIRRSLRSIVTTWLAGLLVLLPLALTLAVLAYAFDLAYRVVGPGSLVGRVFAAPGYPFTSHSGLAYLVGTLVLIGAVDVLGLDIGAMSPVWCFFGGPGGPRCSRWRRARTRSRSTGAGTWRCWCPARRSPSAAR
jgi:hypothetical protein